MAKFLRQSTAAVIPFGPFLDKTDGVTLEVGAGIITSIDHATTGIFLVKNGTTGAIRHQNVTASVLDAYGMFLVTLDTTDTNTLGRLRVMMAEAATFLPVWDDFMVIPATLWDTLMVAQPAAAINNFFDKASPTGTVNSLPDAVAGQASGIAIVGSSMVVPSTQKVDVETIKTQAVTCAAGVTVLPSVGAASAQTATLDTIKADTAAILVDTGTTLDGRIPAALGADGFIKASLFGAMGTALSETAGQLAAAIKKLFDVATPVLTCESVNQVQDNPTTAEIKSALEVAGGHLALIKTAAEAVDTLTKASGPGDLAAILLDTGTDGVIIPAAQKTGFALSATGMDLVGCDVATVGAAPATLIHKVQAIFNRLFAKKTVTATAETAYEKDDTTAMEIFTLADDDTTASRTR